MTNTLMSVNSSYFDHDHDVHFAPRLHHEENQGRGRYYDIEFDRQISTKSSKLQLRQNDKEMSTTV